MCAEAIPDKLLMGTQYCRTGLTPAGETKTKGGGSMQVCR